jgi:hypothetical protein
MKRDQLRESDGKSEDAAVHIDGATQLPHEPLDAGGVG